MGEDRKDALRIGFEGSVKLEVHGSKGPEAVRTDTSRAFPATGAARPPMGPEVARRKGKGQNYLLPAGICLIFLDGLIAYG